LRKECKLLHPLNKQSRLVTEIFNVDVDIFQKLTAYTNNLIDRCKSKGMSQLGPSSLAWLIERVWVDETLTDNEKAFMIFCIGRFFEASMREFGTF